MSTAFFCIDIVYVAENIFRIAVGIFHGYFYNICIFYAFHIDWFSINLIFVSVNILNKFNDASFEMEGLTPAIPFVFQGNGYAFV